MSASTRRPGRPAVAAALVPVAALLAATGAVPAAGAAVAAGCSGTYATPGALVGTPAEDVVTPAGSVRDAGLLQVVPAAATGLGLTGPGTLTLTEAAMGGTVRAGDRFGAAAAFGVNAVSGCTWLAVGAPGADSGAGRVYLAPGSASGGFDLSRAVVLRQGAAGLPDHAEPGDHFGASLVLGGGQGGQPLWLAIGAPGEDLAGQADAGAVTVVRPYDPGTGARFLTRGSAAHVRDKFGLALAVAPDPYSLAVGAPGAVVDGRPGAGLVRVLWGSTTRLPGVVAAYTLTQGTPRIGGVAEAGDRFGAALAAMPGPTFGDRHLVIGVPGEDVGPVVDAGEVLVRYPGSPPTYQTWQADTAGVPGVAQPYDHFGAALAGTDAGLAVGVPGQDVGRLVDAGQLVFLRASTTSPVGRLVAAGAQQVGLGSYGVPGDPQAGAAFGAALALGGGTFVTVGVPGAGVAGAADAGVVVTLPYTFTSGGLLLGRSGSLAQGAPGVGSVPEPGDGFGSALGPLW